MVNKSKRRPERESRAMAATAIRLPSDLHEKLTTAGEASGLGFSGELRSRLERSFDVGTASPETAELLALVGKLAVEIEGTTGRPWAKNAYDFAIFKAGIEMVLKVMEPKEGKQPPGERTLFHLLGYQVEEPEQIARSMVRPILAARGGRG